jgi:hypothetical protein
MARKPGSRSAAHVRSLASSWIRQEWRCLTGVTVLMGIGAAAVALTPAPPMYRGFVVGAIAATWLWIVGAVVVIASGGLSHFWGRGGEAATAQELESRRRRRQGWTVVHGLQLGGGDVDHVAVGGRGVVTIETKWTSAPWRVVRGRLVGPWGDPVAQARRNAWRVAQLLKTRAEAVVLVWGPGCAALPASTEIEGVHVFSGADLKPFRQWLDAVHITDDERRSVTDRLLRYAADQEAALACA